MTAPQLFAMPEYLQSDIITHFDETFSQEAPVYKSLYAFMHKDIREIEALTGNVRDLLRDCDDVLKSEGLSYQVETLERCMDYYRRGAMAARIMTEFGDSWLQDMQCRLRQAIDEQHRFDGEGGSYMASAPDQQAEKSVNRLGEVVARVEATLSAVSSHFPKPFIAGDGTDNQIRH